MPQRKRPKQTPGLASLDESLSRYVAEHKTIRCTVCKLLPPDLMSFVNEKLKGQVVSRMQLSGWLKDQGLRITDNMLDSHYDHTYGEKVRP